MAQSNYLLFIYILLFLPIFSINIETKKLTKSISSQKNDATSESEKKRQITVKNTIDPKDLGYYKFFMTHYPSEFNVFVNGKKLNSKEHLLIEDQKLTVTYNYEWNSKIGRVKKSKTLVYTIDPKIDNIDLSFTSWKEDEPRIKAPGCSLIQVTEVEEANTIPKEQVNQFIAQAEQNK